MKLSWPMLLTFLCVYMLWSQWQHRQVVVNTPDQIAPSTPIQENLKARDSPVFKVKEYTLTAQARYSIEARILRRENYRFGREADLSPVDFALGWGAMSSNSLLDQMTITQSNRFYWLRWQKLDVPEKVVMQHSANTHIIPANKYVSKQIDSMRAGQVVELEGYLVNVHTSIGIGIPHSPAQIRVQVLVSYFG